MDGGFCDSLDGYGHDASGKWVEKHVNIDLFHNGDQIKYILYY